MMMRTSILFFLCACSLVNSTSDLRDQDAASASDAMLDGGPGDAVLGDVVVPGDAVVLGDVPGDAVSGDAVVPGIDAGPPCVPNITRFEVDRPSHPPILAVFFDRSTCTGTLSVTQTESEFVAEMQIVVGDMHAVFPYTGPRVPLIAVNRDRVFSIGGTEYSLQMPVERFQIVGMEGLIDDISYSFNPSLDIANNGTVVFDSDASDLGSQSNGNIFAWLVDGTVNRPATFERPGPGDDQLAAAAISDDGRVIAFTNRTQSSVHLRVRGAMGTVLVPLGTGNLADALNLDIRHVGGTKYALLVRVNARSTITGYLLFDFDSSTGIVRLNTVVTHRSGTQGLLFRSGSDGEFGYAAINGGEVFSVTSGDDSSTPGSCFNADVNETRVHGSDTDGLAYVGDCVGGRKLRVGSLEMDFPNGGLLGAADDHSLLLLRNGRDGEPLDTYTIFDTSGPGTNYTLNLDGQGDVTDTVIEFHFAGAAISPNGEWAAYALIEEDSPEKTMRIHRIRTRSPGSR